MTAVGVEKCREAFGVRGMPPLCFGALISKAAEYAALQTLRDIRSPVDILPDSLIGGQSGAFYLCFAFRSS